MPFNSTIQVKKKICVRCGRESYIFSKGRCQPCTVRDNFKEKMEEEKEERSELNAWYAVKEAQVLMKPNCSNCGKWIPPKYYRHSVAHILPKREDGGFPSVKTHPMNYIILGSGCGCHQNFDRSWQDAQLMDEIWPTVVERFKIIYPFIAKEELKNLPDVLRKEIE